MSQDTTTEDEDVSYLAPVPLGQSDWGGITSTQAPSRTPLPIPDMDIYIYIYIDYYFLISIY